MPVHLERDDNVGKKDQEQKSIYQQGQDILERARMESIQASRVEPLRRRADLSYVVQDLEWSKDTAPQLEIAFCHDSGLVSLQLKIAVGESHEDSISLSEGHIKETIKSILEGYVDVFTRGLESLERSPL